MGRISQQVLIMCVNKSESFRAYFSQLVTLLFIVHLILIIGSKAERNYFNQGELDTYNSNEYTSSRIPRNINPRGYRGRFVRQAEDLEQTTSAPISPSTTQVPHSNATSLLSTNKVHYDARDVTYFLESHPAHSIHDPRVFFTEERTTRSLAIIMYELEKLPVKTRFAYLVRTFNELGRKIASKLNYYSAEVSAILRKTPDDLGNKPEVSMLVDVVNNAFESKEDIDPRDENDQEQMIEDPISRLINSDREKAAVFNSSLIEISNRFSEIIYYLAQQSTKTSIKISPEERPAMASLLGEALHMGAKTMIDELSKNDKFNIPKETASYCNSILEMTIKAFKDLIERNDNVEVKSSIVKIFQAPDTRSYKDLNPMSDKTGLIGPWNNYLFANLGTSERVVKLFASLLSRVPPEAKSRWINMYISQVYSEVERTLSGFVVMQGMPFNKNNSETFLLDPTRSSEIMPNKVPVPRTHYTDDKNRIPARCYLAGRRWRLVLTRALKNYNKRAEMMKAFADKLGEFKIKLVRKSGNEIYRLCMPRVEVGVRGWGINGDPQVDGGQSNKFPMKNPIEDLSIMPDPFISGAMLGYKLGVKVGYNEERNATLELERANRGKGNQIQQLKTETKYLALASFRRATTVGAKKAFEIAVRQGYLTTLTLSVRAGMQIPSEAASRLAALRCTSFAGQAGTEAGRSVVDNFLVDKLISEDMRKVITKVGEAHGLWAGELIGKTIGALVGKEAAEEAYKRSIIRGGKVARARFHLEEYEAGANLGFDYGLSEGKRIASSASLDPSAPRFFQFPQPVFSDEKGTEVEVDHWEKDLIPPLSQAVIEKLQARRNHTLVSGILKGVYKFTKEVKKGMKRVMYSNITYALEVSAKGFIKDDIAYLTLNGTVNNLGVLHGSLVAKDIFNDSEDY